ncbi:GspE/PulE family protein [Marinobacterium lutimaris]|uniref:Type IV pilus assembly protein PilB n=1 Tax=Marinobacterium lutimaris TaxID=568106 RepID=A0A1H5Z309_9GAMM|nr:GspE/PulE family protein [Marinobacterium lutimaris]SEG29746.1 type IV pilus assembly protein PilB [Marinobacterium lutimaris]
MSALDWMLVTLGKAVPEKAEALKSLELPDDQVQAWSVICRTLARPGSELVELLESSGVPVVDLNEQVISTKDIPLPESTARRLHAVLAEIGEHQVVAAVSNPFDQTIKQEIAFSIGRKTELAFAPPEQIANVLNLHYSAFDSLGTRHLWIDNEDLEVSADTDQLISQIAKMILNEAVKMRASDVHIQNFLGGGLIRYRVDGLMVRGSSLPKKVKDAVLRYVMTQSGLDTSNHTTPQDGRLSASVDDQLYDLRVSVLPSRDDSRLVLRLLDKNRKFSSDSLGFPLREQRQLELLSRQNQGLILFTGPTGAGKTTSLYSLLAGINTPERNIMTAEDPVEYSLPGISQIEVDTAHGRSFDTVLRSMLRQDPDVILVGEVRDEPTASMVMRAVMTGHLVFSTLHTIDALGTVQRLVDLGVTQGQIADSLTAVVAQRMVRRVCPVCAVRVEDDLTPIETLFANAVQEKPTFRAVGCNACNHTGYKGRIPLVEVYTPSDEDRRLLRTENYLRSADVELERSLATVAWHEITSGLTTVDEVTRVLGASFWKVIDPTVTSDALGSVSDNVFQRKQPGLMLFGADDEVSSRIGSLIDRPLIRVYSGEEGAEILRRDALVFGLIVYVDVARDPVNYLKQLRTHMSWCGLPVIMVLSAHNTEVEDYLRWRGYAEWCIWPIDEEQFRRLCVAAVDL